MKAAEEKRANRLGRGLSALMGDQDPEPGNAGAKPSGAREVPIEQLRPNRGQPRKHFDEEELRDLANSIREKGVLQPILVRPLKNQRNLLEIVAGERRWRAAQLARRHTVPVIERDMSEAEALEIGIIENVQRTDLNAMEEAAGYQALLDQFGYTQEELAKVIGKSRSHLANMMRLLTLPKPVQGQVRDGKLSAGHARALVGAKNADALAKQIVAEGLSVRDTEALLREEKGGDKPGGKKSAKGKAGAKNGKAASASGKDSDTVALERDVSNALGLTVSIDHEGDAGGSVTVSYKTLEQLDEICRRLGQG